MNKMINLIREISKVLMFTVLWGIPVVLARMFESNVYLWLFIGSMIASAGMFSHYEDLAKIENNVEQQNNE